MCRKYNRNIEYVITKISKIIVYLLLYLEKRRMIQTSINYIFYRKKKEFPLTQEEFINLASLSWKSISNTLSLYMTYSFEDSLLGYLVGVYIYYISYINQ